MIPEDVFPDRVTVESEHIASRHLVASALLARAFEWTPAATTPAAVIGSHHEQRRGRGRAGDRYRDIASVSRRGPPLLRFAQCERRSAPALAPPIRSKHAPARRSAGARLW